MERIQKVYFSEKNIHGAWVVYGIIGIRQYYYYTKREAERLYREQVDKELCFNRPIRKR